MSVPEGWFNYTCFGKPIQNTRIFATKTPLKKSFNCGEKRSVLKDDFRKVALEEEFTPTHLMDMLLERHHTLGLVIDLTFTSRYYSPREFEDRGVKHLKILCPGRDIPDDNVYTQFAEALNAFLVDPSNKDKLVAVHCTHGLNRTGYLICRYLLQECHYDVEDAIDAFNHARGHCIERKNYLDHLRQGCPEPMQVCEQSNGSVASRKRSRDTSDYCDNSLQKQEPPSSIEHGRALNHTHLPLLEYHCDNYPSMHQHRPYSSHHSRSYNAVDRYTGSSEYIRPSSNGNGRQTNSNGGASSASRRQEGPSIRQEGPSGRQEGPSRRQEGPSRRQEGPSRRQEGPSRRQEGPSRRQEGPSLWQEELRGLQRPSGGQYSSYSDRDNFGSRHSRYSLDDRRNYDKDRDRRAAAGWGWEPEPVEQSHRHGRHSHSHSGSDHSRIY